MRSPAARRRRRSAAPGAGASAASRRHRRSRSRPSSTSTHVHAVIMPGPTGRKFGGAAPGRPASVRAWPRPISTNASRGRTRRSGRRCSSRESSTRRWTSSPTWPGPAPRSSSASGPVVSRCRSAGAGVPVHGIELSPAMVAELRTQARCRRDRRHDRRLRHHDRRRDVHARVPGAQHDHEPDDPGRAGRVLPQRRRPSRARRLLRDRDLRPGAAAPAAGRDRSTRSP